MRLHIRELWFATWVLLLMIITLAFVYPLS